MDKQLTVIIPAYNEEKSLELHLKEITDFCSKNNYALIIVNDGSKDKTKNILENELKVSEFIAINHKLNKGYGAAIKAGIEVSETKYSITFDADGQHDLDSITILLNKIVETDADLIIGSRKGSPNENSTLFKGIGKYFIRKFAQLLVGTEIYDLNSGLKVFDTSIARSFLFVYPTNFAFSDVFALTFINNRCLVLEEKIMIKERILGESKVRIKTAFETLYEILNIVILFNPLRIFLPIAVIFMILGLGWSVVIFLRGHGISVGGSLVIILGFLSFMIGLVAEQLSKIRLNNS